MKKEIIIIRGDVYYSDQELSSIMNECCSRFSTDLTQKEKNRKRIPEDSQNRSQKAELKTGEKEKFLIVPLRGGSDRTFQQVRRFASAYRLRKTEVVRNGKTAAIGLEPAEPNVIDELASQYHLYLFAWDKLAA